MHGVFQVLMWAAMVLVLSAAFPVSGSNNVGSRLSRLRSIVASVLAGACLREI